MTDPGEIRRLFEEEGAEKKRIAVVEVQADTEYWRTFEPPYPVSAGAAFGFDRMMMILSGKQNIREVIYFPY